MTGSGPRTMEKGFAERFVREWIAAWNSHDSVTVYYKGQRGLSAEVLHFGPHGKVRAAFAHYAERS